MATTIISENNHPSFTLIKSSKGGNKLIEGGFIYGQQRRVGEVVHWQCERRRVCKARVLTKGSQIVKRTNEHLHEPDEESVTSQKVKLGVKRKASETQDSSHLIVGDSLLTVSDGVSVKLPKLTSLKRTIQRQRERILAAPAQPLTLEELILPPDYQQTAKGENFLFHDSGSGPDRIIIFGTQRNLEMLESSQYWLADGTFKTAPELFLQSMSYMLSEEDLTLYRMVTCYQACSSCYPTKLRLPTRGCGNKLKHFVLTLIQAR